MAPDSDATKDSDNDGDSGDRRRRRSSKATPASRRSRGRKDARRMPPTRTPRKKGKAEFSAAASTAVAASGHAAENHEPQEPLGRGTGRGPGGRQCWPGRGSRCHHAPRHRPAAQLRATRRRGSRTPPGFPSLLDSQVQRIATAVATVVASGDNAKNAKELESRVTGMALEVRTANYKIRSKVATQAGAGTRQCHTAAGPGGHHHRILAPVGHVCHQG